jgi:hypothetical protein
VGTEEYGGIVLLNRLSLSQSLLQASHPCNSHLANDLCDGVRGEERGARPASLQAFDRSDPNKCMCIGKRPWGRPNRSSESRLATLPLSCAAQPFRPLKPVHHISVPPHKAMVAIQHRSRNPEQIEVRESFEAGEMHPRVKLVRCLQLRWGCSGSRGRSPSHSALLVTLSCMTQRPRRSSQPLGAKAKPATT